LSAKTFERIITDETAGFGGQTPDQRSKQWGMPAIVHVIREFACGHIYTPHRFMFGVIRPPFMLF
jgi:hypothetical protein